MKDSERDTETQAEGEAGSCREPDEDSIPGPQNHALNQRQMFNH